MSRSSEDARQWQSPSVVDARKHPDPGAIVRILSRATRLFVKPLSTQIMLDGRSLFELLVSTVCSAQARDATTYPRMVALFHIAHTPEAMARMPLARLKKILYPISYYNTKAKHLIALSKMLRRTYGGNVPRTMEALTQLPGVGRKTANIVLTEGLGLVRGIAVDTHVHRISNRLGIVRTATRAETERALLRIVPRRFWARWNPLLVLWGQNICTPISPKCSTCPLLAQCQRRGVSIAR